MKLATKAQVHTVLTLVKAAVALHASILAWVGGYDLLYYGTGPTPDDGTRNILQPRLAREITYIAIGFIIMILTDSLYANAGIPATLFPHLCYSSNAIVAIRAAFGLAASMLVWTGQYTALDEYTWNSTPARNAAFYIAGSIGLVLTNTYYDMAFIYPPGTSSQDIVTSRSKAYKHVITAIRATASITCQNLMWVGMYNLLELYSEQSFWREIAFIAIGIMLFNATNVFIPLSWIVVDAQGHEKQIEANFSGQDLSDESVLENEPTFLFYVRATVAIFAQILHNTGIWSLLDNYVAPQVDSLERNLICLFVGIFLLWITGVLVKNSCITPIMTPIWESPDIPSEEKILAASQAADESLNPTFDPDVLNSAVSIMPSARGRLQRRRHETEFDGSRAMSSRYEPVSQLDVIQES
jgi:hypothetical protein